MKHMTQFNKGWWNCFSTIISELNDNNHQLARNIAQNVIESAGVDEDEIQQAIENDLLYDDVVDLLSSK